ncbi:MAG: DUF2798 domain-containing protein [Pseudomonadota bacterium]
MLNIPSRFFHFVYGVIQSGLTSAIATAIASLHFLDDGLFVHYWMRSWLLSWGLMLPVVILAAPLIRKLTLFLTANAASSPKP